MYNTLNHTFLIGLFLSQSVKQINRTRSLYVTSRLHLFIHTHACFGREFYIKLLTATQVFRLSNYFLQKRGGRGLIEKKIFEVVEAYSSGTSVSKYFWQGVGSLSRSSANAQSSEAQTCNASSRGGAL